MSLLSITLFGSPQISVDGIPLKITTHRVIPLFAYLALSEKTLPRETIAGLLWSDSPLTQALASLRTTLWRLKSEGLEEWINLENDSISLNNQKNIEIDAVEFKVRIYRCTTHGHPPSKVCLYCIPSLTEAYNLYRGSFMAGVNLSHASVFDDWIIQEAENFHLAYIDVLERLVKGHRTLGDFNLAIQYARILLSHDRYNEVAQFDLLQLYSITGQRAAAITQYKRYKEIISRDLNIQPAKEITDLYKQVLSGREVSTSAPIVSKPIFLIADIENASALLNQSEDVKSNLLFTYYNIINEAARRFSGKLIQKSGDRITLLFEQGQPLLCAISIHNRLKTADWDSVGLPKVRMVLYSTATEENQYSDFSTITKASSNLLTMLWGGQVVFSEQTMMLLDQPAGSKIIDLGIHTVKDFSLPVHLYELHHPYLPEIESHPLQSLYPQAINFPGLNTPFVGRESELSQLANEISYSDSKLITLVGPGGVGKTRLAVQFARQYINLFPDGAYFISLAQAQNPDEIPIILADGLQFTFYGPTNYKEQLGDFLHRMKALLVLDNFEQLRGEGVKFITYLLDNTHSVQILVTSRERLNLHSETIVEVQGLEVPPLDSTQDVESYSSIQLFVQNAHRLSSRFNFKANRSDVINICRLVNGLPLGIILASSWIRTYSCQEILSEIKKSIDFLETSAPDIPIRHRSLRAVFDSSWNQLSIDERLILSRLSIFQAPFTLSAAEKICSASAQMLTGFLDKSLLSYQDNRYEMLDTFRMYSMGRIKEIPEENKSTQANFIKYYFDFCLQKNQQIYSDQQLVALMEMSLEFENIRTAWNLMVETDCWQLIEKIKQTLVAYLSIRANFLEGRAFFRIALDRLEKLDDPSLERNYASMQQLEGWMAHCCGFTNEGIKSLHACLEVFIRYRAEWDILTSYFYLAAGYRAAGNFIQAKMYIDQALELFQTMNVPETAHPESLLAYGKAILGHILINLEQFDQARKCLLSSLEFHRGAGVRNGAILPLLGLGNLYFTQGEFIESRDYYLQALEIASKINEKRSLAVIHNNLSGVYESIAEPTASHHHILEALQICEGTGDRRLLALILNNQAYHQWRFINHPSEAIHTYHQSIMLFSELGDLRGLAYSYYDLSKAYAKVGLYEDAWSACLRSLQTSMTMDSISLCLHSLHGFAHLLEQAGDLDRSLRLLILVENHPQVDTDTKKRAIVSRVILQTKVSPDLITAARSWAVTTDLQDVIDQLLSEKYRFGNGESLQVKNS